MSQDPIERAKVLLEAAHQILRQANQSPLVRSPMEMTAHYDEADCDGYCLATDIEYWFEFEAKSPLKTAFTL